MSWAGRISGIVEFVSDIVFASGGTATSKGVGDDEIESQVGWHLGFYSRPKDGARGVVVKMDGEGNSSFLIAWRDKQYEMSLKKGEVGIKNAFDAEILLNEDGEIVINGGTKKVARVDDTTKNGSLLFVPGSGGASLSYIPPGVPVVLPPGASQIDLEGVIDKGADKVKA